MGNVGFNRCAFLDKTVVVITFVKTINIFRTYSYLIYE